MDCKQKLETAFEFQQQIISFDNQLRKLLQTEPKEELVQFEMIVRQEPKTEVDEEVLYEVQESDDVNIEIEDDSEYEEASIKDEKGDGFEEVDIPLNDSDFSIEHNIFGNEDNKVLAKLAFSMPKPKDFTAPDEARLLYKGTIRHYQCLRCHNVYSPRNKILHHLKTCDGTAKDDGDSGEFTEQPAPKISAKERKKLAREAASKQPKHFQCDQCSKVFKHAGTLKSHKARHEGNLPFLCPCCPARFLWQQALDRHMRTHTGERECTCDICGKGFATKTGADLHKRLHFNDLRYHCDQCGKKFNTKSNLIVSSCHYYRFYSAAF